MDDDNDEIDEVALNVLLAEGVDFPTSWEASRRAMSAESPGHESATTHWGGLVMLLVIAIVAAIALVF